MEKFLRRFIEIQAEQNEILKKLHNSSLPAIERILLKDKFDQNQKTLRRLPAEIEAFWGADIHGTHDRA